jgi:hypothetical protein
MFYIQICTKKIDFYFNSKKYFIRCDKAICLNMKRFPRKLAQFIVLAQRLFKTSNFIIMFLISRSKIQFFHYTHPFWCEVCTCVNWQDKPFFLTKLKRIMKIFTHLPICVLIVCLKTLNIPRKNYFNFKKNLILLTCIIS